MSMQLELWETPAPPREDQELTCSSCGKTQRMPVFGWNHTLGDGWCISKFLRRNHVVSLARAIATNGVWPGREGSKPPKGWTVERGYEDLRLAYLLAREVGVDADVLDGLIAAEGIEAPHA